MIELGEAQPWSQCAAALGECPLWSAAQQCLYWVDIAGLAIHRKEFLSGRETRWPMPAEPGCIALAPGGALIVALRDGFHRFDPASGALDKIADAPYDVREFRFNDGRCDARGRFFAGAMLESRTAERASMYCLERGQVREVWGAAQGWGVKVSNGLAFSPDGRTLYQSDTPNHVVYRFDYDLVSGSVRNRREFFRCAANRGDPAYGGRPDGAAVDAEGCYWTAQFEGAQVLRVSPRGEMLARVRVAAVRPTMVAFGGADLRTLFITTAREGLAAEELRRFPASGRVFAIALQVAGLPEPQFAE
jgi:sugar lactone lactonase YvrE